MKHGVSRFLQSGGMLSIMINWTQVASAADLQWRTFTGKLPLKLTGPAFVSEPVTFDNPMLRSIKEKWYELPWAPAEAMRLRLTRPQSTAKAFGFWVSQKEYCLLVRNGNKWRQATPSGRKDVSDPSLAYFGHEVSGQAVAWSQPAAVLVVGDVPDNAIQALRVPLFDAGCTAMTLERGERELNQARECLRWMQKPDATVGAAVEKAEASLRETKARLDRETFGLLDAYTHFPEPAYALEDMAYFSRLFHRGGEFKRFGYESAWESVFDGRPEFAPCMEARKAAQQALWAERPQTLKAETARVFGANARFAASITHGLTKFRRDKPIPELLKTTYRMNLAREEYESFQVVVTSLEAPVHNAQVKVQWEGAGPHPEVLLRPAGYVQTKPDPDNYAEYIGWWPDPLMPPGAADITAGEVQPFWGTVRALKNTAAGDHRAKVIVTADGMPPLTCTLTAHVFDFALGFTHLPSLLSLRLDSIKAFYKLKEVPREVKRRWYAFCLDYRMNPNNIYGSESIPEEEDLDFCLQRGFNAMVMATPSLRTDTRNRRDNLALWVSDDNVTYRKIEGDWQVTHDESGGLVLSGLDVKARFLKVNSLCEDEAGEFVVKSLEPGRIVAFDGVRQINGPVGYAGADDGSKPLGSFGATWGAALDYRRASLGLDQGETQQVTRLVLNGPMEGMLDRVKRFYATAKAHGLGDRAYVYGFDEWSEVKRYGEIKTTYDLLKQVAPGIKSCSTVVHPVEPITKVIDAWCPCLCYEYGGYKAARQRGQEVWYYAGGTPYDPFPTHELLDVPAVEARAFFWPAWRFQYTGWLHWELNCWYNNLEGDKRWPEIPWDPARSGVRNGEVGRIYPGPDATPLPSVRLENMRDGIEDYDYFWLLNNAARKLRASDPRRKRTFKLIDDSIQALCPSRAHFERDPVRVLAIHERLGKALEELL
ncbi:MAG: DUF4091 domain-containing protein [Armatimonadetes bacterium]|nr:DUF4091 domain-containing protein [Armatimonadota bacterium]